MIAYLSRKAKENPDIMEVSTYQRGDDIYFDGISVVRPAYMVKFKFCKDHQRFFKLFSQIEKWANKNDCLIGYNIIHNYILIQPVEDRKEVDLLLKHIGLAQDEFNNFDHEKRITCGEMITNAEARKIMEKWKAKYIKERNNSHD